MRGRGIWDWPGEDAGITEVVLAVLSTLLQVLLPHTGMTDDLKTSPSHRHVTWCILDFHHTELKHTQ